MEGGIQAENLSDEAIVELVSQDKEFFGILIRRYEKRMLSYLRRINGGTEEELEDMAQNIFIKAYVYLHSYRKGERFSSWLFGIAHNECIDFWRKNKKHTRVISLEASESLSAVLRTEEDLQDMAERNWNSEMIRKSIGELPFKYQEILVLRFLEERSYEEIAEILKKPVSTVGTLVRRAKKLLKDRLNQ